MVVAIIGTKAIQFKGIEDGFNCSYIVAGKLSEYFYDLDELEIAPKDGLFANEEESIYGLSVLTHREDTMAETNHEGIGRFIYGAYCLGGTGRDVENWMADDLGVARPDPESDELNGELYTAFFAKHTDIDELQANYARFIDSLHSRAL